MPWSSKELFKLFKKIDTPALLIHEQRMLDNIEQMQQLADKQNLMLRPHCKTHKSPDLAKIQKDHGARGITVAKLSEAELFAEQGFDDIFIANEIAHPLKLERLKQLNEKIRIIIAVDNPQQVDLLETVFKNSRRKLTVRIEIDCGFGRCGVPADNPQLLNLVQMIVSKEWLQLEGIFTHGGQSYAAEKYDDIRKAAANEAGSVITGQSILEKNGIKIASISVGSTPTAREVSKIKGITELRPGNYIFYDAIQESLGSCSFEQCSLFVLATIVAQPKENQLVIDAGSKALNLDRGVNAAKRPDGYGYLPDIPGSLNRLSEEHGIISILEKKQYKIGSPVLVIPNHACVTANLYEKYHLVKSDLSVQTLPILARGKSQ